MKQRGFIRELVDAGCYLKRMVEDTAYMNPMNGKKAPVHRHSEIKDSPCELIRKQLGSR